jgi:hypothetical protein
MGTWNTSISGNDTFWDIYDEITKRFDHNEHIETILRTTLEKYERDFEDEPIDMHSLCFAVAKAGWERGCLPDGLFEKVRSIIVNGEDIRAWRELGAGDSVIRRRESVLQEFLAKISVPSKKPKKVKTIISRPAVFKKGDVLSIYRDDGTYGGAVVMEEYCRDEFGSNLIVQADLSSCQIPSVESVLEARVYTFSEYGCHQFRMYRERIKAIGTAKILHSYSAFPSSSVSSWVALLEPYNDSFRRENGCVDVRSVGEFIDRDLNQLNEISHKRTALSLENLKRNIGITPS